MNSPQLERAHPGHVAWNLRCMQVAAYALTSNELTELRDGVRTFAVITICCMLLERA